MRGVYTHFYAGIVEAERMIPEVLANPAKYFDAIPPEYDPASMRIVSWHPLFSPYQSRVPGVKNFQVMYEVDISKYPLNGD